MEESYLYRRISTSIRQQIQEGELKPGDRLPSVREMMTRWKCTIGTVQHAYQELAAQGLIESHVGQGTRVVKNVPILDNTPFRRASVIHRAEAFLLEVLTAGYTPSEVEDAVRQALDRWRNVSQQSQASTKNTLIFTGSHDLAVAWIATHFPEIVQGYNLQLNFSGSLGGLIALAEGKADLAGCHLWDEESDTYNLPFIRRILPSQSLVVVTLAHRRLGLITHPGNPEGVHSLAELTQSGLRFVNRQSGSGTRVWLDAQLHRQGISPTSLSGYHNEKNTHSEVARAIAEDQADVGLGLEGAARLYGLDFVFLAQERYDLVFLAERFNKPEVQMLVQFINGQQFQELLTQLGGYDKRATGDLQYVT